VVAWALVVDSLRRILPASNDLAYTIAPGQGPYLALLHGFLSSSAQWMHNLQALGEVCTPVTIDLWGHGGSAAPEDPALYEPDAYVEALERIRLELNAERWFLCGYSLGAGITIRYTHRYPSRVLGHLFTNSSSGFAPDDLAQKWRDEAEASAAHILNGGREAIERIAVHPKFAKRLPADISAALVADAAAVSPLGIANTLRATTPNVSIRDIAESNPRPALLCFGAHEKRFKAARDWAQDNMPQLSIAELDAGHAVNIEDSSGFNDAATRFIMQHSP